MKILAQKIMRRLCIYAWPFVERLGFHIVPNHFYWPFFNSRHLYTYDFESKFQCEGIDFPDEKMREILSAITHFSDEYQPLHTEDGYPSNGDGAILYGLIRYLKPRHVVEIGSGRSSVITYEAMKLNANEYFESLARLTCIEPYPSEVLRTLSLKDNVELIEDKAESIEPSYFSCLASGDVLFIDSSHVADIGNDVHHLYLRVLPRLPVGVYVHIHDIRLPFDYPRSWVVDQKKHWTEQYLLHMFLAFNNSFEVVFASNYMFDQYKSEMVEALPGLDSRGWPGGFWIQRKK